MSTATATPAVIARQATARRTAAQVRWMRARRRDAIRNGMAPYVPLTREELAARAGR